MTDIEKQQFADDLNAVFEKHGAVDYFYGMVDVAGATFYQFVPSPEVPFNYGQRVFTLIGISEMLKSKMLAPGAE